jgi:hypothetical protein
MTLLIFNFLAGATGHHGRTSELSRFPAASVPLWQVSYAGQQRSSLPHRGERNEIVKRHQKDAQNVPMTSQPSRAGFLVRANARMSRLGVAVVALASCLVLAQCSWLGSPPAPNPAPSGSIPTPAARTLSNANLIKAGDLPPPIGGGKVISYDRNARSLDELSICQTQPLNALGASAIKSRSFQSRYPSGDRPFARSSLDDEPDSYAVALQFSDPAAAARAKSAIEGWVSNCIAGGELPNGRHVLRQGVEWTGVTADPAQAQVTEIVYQRNGSSSSNAYFESIGLTVLQDRMMITVHLFYTDESPYSLDLAEEEAGFAHPQLGLIDAAVKRLSH